MQQELEQQEIAPQTAITPETGTQFLTKVLWAGAAKPSQGRVCVAIVFPDGKVHGFNWWQYAPTNHLLSVLEANKDAKLLTCRIQAVHEPFQGNPDRATYVTLTAEVERGDPESEAAHIRNETKQLLEFFGKAIEALTFDDYALFGRIMGEISYRTGAVGARAKSLK